jgi:hypothetical protein
MKNVEGRIKKIARKSEANVVVAKNEESQNVSSIITSLGVMSEQIEKIILVTSSLRAMQV